MFQIEQSSDWLRAAPLWKPLLVQAFCKADEKLMTRVQYSTRVPKICLRIFWTVKLYLGEIVLVLFSVCVLKKIVKDSNLVGFHFFKKILKLCF